VPPTVILATWEAEMGRIVVQKTLISKLTRAKWTEVVTQVYSICFANVKP
jgi:hypothetical protein